MKKYLIALTMFASIVLFPACNKATSKLEGACMHPAAGAMPFPIPAGSSFSSFGGLIIPSPDGSTVTLTGAVCVIQSGK